MNQILSWLALSIRKAGWVPICFFLLHLVVSKGLDGYITFPWLDIPMHFFGGVAISYFFRSSLMLEETKSIFGPLTRFGQAVLLLTSVCASAVLWEFAEWTSDSFGYSEAQLGLDDTLFDMFLGVAGGAILLLALPFPPKAPGESMKKMDRV